MAKKFLITRGQFFLVSFSFFYSSFVAFPCRTIIILTAKSSAVLEDLGMLILPSNLDEAVVILLVVF